MINETQIEKYYHFLKDLKNRSETEEIINGYELCRAHTISTVAFTMAHQSKLIKKLSQGLYNWNTIEPNRHMAKKLKEEVSKYQRENYKSKPKKVSSKNNNTQYKHLSVLFSLYTNLQVSDTVVIQDFVKEHKVSNNFIYACITIGVIEKTGRSRYKWIGRKPDLKMAIELKENYNYATLKPKTQALPRTQEKPNIKIRKLDPIEVSLFFGLIKFKVYK